MKKMCVCYQKFPKDEQPKTKIVFLLNIFNIKFIYKKIKEIIRFNQFINLFLFSINQLMENFFTVFHTPNCNNLDAKISNLDAKFPIFPYIFTQLRRQDLKLRRQHLTGCDQHV
jgi:hypothetical protein